MNAQRVLPAELVSLVLSYTTIRDVVRWRTVSKWFQTVTHDPAIWETLRAGAPFLRPSPDVSSEHTLIRSARLAHSWTSQPLKVSSYFQIPCDTCPRRHSDIIGGRWLLACQEWRRFVFYDIRADARTPPQVIWEQEEKQSKWDCTVGKFEDGKWFVYISLTMVYPPRCTLLEVHVDADSGEPCDTVVLDVPRDGPMHPIRICGEDIHARSPFLLIEARCLVFDTRTRIFYSFPEIDIALSSTRSRVEFLREDRRANVVLTNTHIIVLHHTGFVTSAVVIQAFTVPDYRSTVEETNVLRLSHEGIDSDITTTHTLVAIIRNSIVDPVTGSTNVKLFRRSLKGGFNGDCTELTLHAPSPVGVSPITVKRSDFRIVMPVTNEIEPFYIQDVEANDIFRNICDDGYGRGFFIESPFKCLTYRGVTKFELDATQDGCVAVLSPFSCMTLPVCAAKSFDGLRGRFFYVYNHTLTVMDFE